MVVRLNNLNMSDWINIECQWERYFLLEYTLKIKSPKGGRGGRGQEDKGPGELKLSMTLLTYIVSIYSTVIAIVLRG